MVRRLLLASGIVSSLLYVVMTVFVAMQWDGYSSASQTISELSAIGAPTRSLWVVPGALYTLLVTAFGWGVWKSAGGIRALRRVGGLIAAYGALGLAWPGRLPPCTFGKRSQRAGARSAIPCTSSSPA
jgi:hypothetical protein